MDTLGRSYKLLLLGVKGLRLKFYKKMARDLDDQKLAKIFFCSTLVYLLLCSTAAMNPLTSKI